MSAAFWSPSLIADSIVGSPIGLRLGDDGALALGASLPEGFPTKRLIENTAVVLADLVPLHESAIQQTDFLRCSIFGPALLLPLGCVFRHCQFGPSSANLVIEVPDERAPAVGAIVLIEAELADCELHDIALLVAKGRRSETLRGLGINP